MVEIVIAALAKGMAVANLTLEESLTLLNASLRPFLGIGKYSDLNSSIDDPYGASASLQQARNSYTAVLLTKYRPARERYLIRTSEPSRLSSVVQSVGIAKSLNCLLDNPTTRAACPSELMSTRWVCRFKLFSLGNTQQAFPNFWRLAVS